MTTYRYFATASRGAGFLLADELRALGASDVREQGAGVSFTGDLETGYRACLWSRLANRVLCELASFDAVDADSLYAGVAALDWPTLHAPGASFAVHATGTTPALNNTQFTALKVKDAVVDRLREARGERPSVDPAEPDLALFVRLHKGRATLSFDLAGRPLHRRGYRREAGEAPLRETLAAALLVRAGWPQIAADGGALLDPMCGAGTIPIEAAMIATDFAPGLFWGAGGLRGWTGHDRALWQRLLAEADDRHDAAQQRLPTIVGSDRDARVIEVAKRNARAAGFPGIRFEVASVEHAQPPGETGLVILNPPYGERLAHDAMLVPLYTTLGQRLKQAFAGWRMAILTPTPELGFHTGLRSHRQTRFDNGPIECRLLEFEVHERAVGTAVEAPAAADDFANRLKKNVKNLGKWAEREGVECFRVYDADLPEYALAIDLYGEFAHVQEYAPPKTIDPVKARKRLDAALAVLPGVLGVEPGAVFLKQRKRGKGGERYGKLADKGRYYTVTEGPAKFWVNFTDHLDTGLFLDHRPVRALIRENAARKRFLNLFCYTATATVHAALGGAASSTSVDLSNTYLDWAKRNFVLNGVDLAKHQLVHADVTKWLKSCTERYDLVFLDPPTFSSSKRMEGVLDIQRDHVELIHDALRCTAPGGTLLFSTNHQGFKLDAEALADLAVDDLSAKLLPEDFKRRPKIHRVWKIQM